MSDEFKDFDLKDIVVIFLLAILSPLIIIGAISSVIFQGLSIGFKQTGNLLEKLGE